MEKLTDLEKIINSELTTKINSSEIKQDQINLIIDTEDLIEVYKDSKKLMPLIHLPVQSGSDKILNLMNRKHTVKEYLKTYERLKKINPLVEFSSDFIIAYPGEEEKDFIETLNLIKEVKFTN